jgi:hypothetical protein
MIQNWAQQAAEALEKDHPGWSVTVIFRATQPPLFCARRSGEDVNAYRSEDPDELADAIEQEEI